MTLPSKHLKLFRALFRGRSDLFAIRWEKGKKSGYMPAYTYDPYLYRVHRMKGGTFKNYPHPNSKSISWFSMKTKKQL